MRKFVVYEIWTKARIIEAKNTHDAYQKTSPHLSGYEEARRLGLRFSNWHAHEIPSEETPKEGDLEQIDPNEPVGSVLTLPDGRKIDIKPITEPLASASEIADNVIGGEDGSGKDRQGGQGSGGEAGGGPDAPGTA